MKKIYLGILTFISVATFAQTVPTCSLDPAFVASNKVGVYPDSATNFVSGTVGVPYVQNLTIKVPKDTTSSGIKFCFNKFVISTPSGVTNYDLPPGLTMGSSTSAVNNGTVNGAPSLMLPGAANNCASIYGTPTTAGVYTLQISVQPYLSLAGGTGFGTCSTPANTSGGSASISPAQNLRYYIITISPAVGVRELANDRVSLSQNFPNPSNATTDIKFYVEGQDNATVTLYNALGAEVSVQTVKTSVGENVVSINTSVLPEGTYMYSLKYKEALISKRMVVIHN